MRRCLCVHFERLNNDFKSLDLQKYTVKYNNKYNQQNTENRKIGDKGNYENNRPTLNIYIGVSAFVQNIDLLSSRVTIVYCRVRRLFIKSQEA